MGRFFTKAQHVHYWNDKTIENFSFNERGYNEKWSVAIILKYRDTVNNDKSSNSNNNVDNCNQTANSHAIFFSCHHIFYCLISIIKVCSTITMRLFKISSY